MHFTVVFIGVVGVGSLVVERLLAVREVEVPGLNITKRQKRIRDLAEHVPLLQ